MVTSKNLLGEMPQDALVREFLEETGALINHQEPIGVRFNQKIGTLHSVLSMF